ncbi:MAG: 16S rRNA (cytosine(1402)-N(4))-methyltransferase RsmH [Christensenellales bacterium]|uniref:Ribosomal RNA small subunit methyltransferase H n=1 Tax=Candidatus Avichristensenella intestinipullorum TaxID=2840693 RepID=A0A9D0YVX5_9FIRM|nr:16S rRNA (cytosine(1402)-N(4))-methyltransferase RsmH [Christensenellales bacterium]HIQ62963.1 16S rRNA (cytosine(1402)-N(4))-methyltransferase RsmH [Candidatus Avichristensenella intestinipullorum]
MFQHQPVMLREVVEFLAPAPGRVFVDGTLGGGGHSEALLRAGAGVFGVDRDQDALDAAGVRLAEYGNFHALYGNFHDLRALLQAQGVGPVDGILLDLGVSSYQLDTAERGFSYHADAPLDMRMDRRQSFDAKELVNTWSEQEIARVLRDYGEEAWAARIAQMIVEHRARAPLATTGDLVRAVDAAIPRKVRDRDTGHSAQKTFQALRIAVNDELAPLGQALEDAVSLLRPGGRLCVITFHSLEDRIVKQTFRRLERPCTCPPGLPVCICGKKPSVGLPVRGALKPGAEEIAQNPRARSAKLRVAQKL